MKKELTDKQISKFQKNINNLLHSKNITHGLARSLRQLSKELILYKNHLNGVKIIKSSKNELFNKEKIQIGGGGHILEDYLNIDIVPPADLIWDVRENIPLKTECSKHIFCEHFLEHIDYPISVKKFINECYRILSPGGQLIIGVPNSELIINNYLKKNYKFYKKMFKSWYSKRNCLNHFNTYIDLLNYHFRDQDDDQKYTPHLWAYDYEKLESLLKEANFLKIKPWKFNKIIANPKRKWGSIYIIATK